MLPFSGNICTTSRPESAAGGGGRGEGGRDQKDGNQSSGKTCCYRESLMMLSFRIMIM